jgi:hypothetical protein
MSIEQGQNRTARLAKKCGRQTFVCVYCTHIGCYCTLFSYIIQRFYSKKIRISLFNRSQIVTAPCFSAWISQFVISLRFYLV